MTTPEPATYSGDPTTAQQDEVRFLIGDTGPTFQLSDPEIDYLLGKWLPLYPSVLFVAAMAARALARGYAGLATISADGVSVDVASLINNYNTLADQLMAQYELESEFGIDWTDTLFDDCFHPRVFEMGNMDIPGVNQGGFIAPERRSLYQHGEYDGYLA